MIQKWWQTTTLARMWWDVISSVVSAVGLRGKNRLFRPRLCEWIAFVPHISGAVGGLLESVGKDDMACERVNVWK